MWGQEVGSQMEIGVANSGYRWVKLRCGADYMQVDVETDQDFGGVIYTRGSYHNKKPPCFLDPRSGHSFSLKFPLSQCQTKLVSKHAYFLICTRYTKLVPFGITGVKPPKYQTNFTSVHYSCIFRPGQIALWRKSVLFAEHNTNAMPGTSPSNQFIWRRLQHSHRLYKHRPWSGRKNRFV
jgi:hypothetical protein